MVFNMEDKLVFFFFTLYSSFQASHYDVIVPSFSNIYYDCMCVMQRAKQQLFTVCVCVCACVLLELSIAFRVLPSV